MSDAQTNSLDTSQPERPWAAPLVVVSTIAGFALAIGRGHETNVWWSTALAGAVGLVLALSLFPRVTHHWGKVGFTTLSAGLGFGVAQSLATVWGFHVLSPHVASLELQAQELYAMLETSTPNAIRLLVLGALIFAEEFIYRGVAFDFLKKRWGTQAAIALATLLYATPQIASGSWVLVLIAVVCGLVWTLQRAVYRGIFVPLLTHIVWDVCIFFVFPLVP